MKQSSDFLFRLKGIFIFLILIFSVTAQNTITFSGQVVDTEIGRPIAGANVISGEIGTTTDNEGSFTIEIPKGEVVTISFIGYEPATVTPSGKQITVELVRTVLRGEEIVVLANRAVAGVTPVAFSTLTPEEISQRYTVEDVPMTLAREPGVYAYSESGNGTGYSYVSIRGFDQSRISVMLDNVPLNDNESHQVYWVDHGDILSDAKDVQIQRGIGNSLYGSAAFGGSINVLTQIASDQKELSASVTGGSFNTIKYRAKVNSGRMLGNNLSLTARVSQIESDGYREYHESLQRSVFVGLEHRGEKITNQFRANIGYENTDLNWDGIAAADISDRTLRRAGYKSYTDDFLQQIYSLNTSYQIKPGMYFHNVGYLVLGSGYYEVFKSGRDFYSYNLDVDDHYSDVEELGMETDLLRRKWIVNRYYGIVPTVTWMTGPLRFDLGSEIRFYSGDHFGEVTNFSNAVLVTRFGEEWYKYYQYIGTKRSFSAFAHIVYSMNDRLKLIADIQLQGHQWELDQKMIGHAAGHQLSADWGFINPRAGFVFAVTDQLAVFGNYGKSQKEPADSQIIEADDVWSNPVMAAAEGVDDIELGANLSAGVLSGTVNLYRITYANEQLKNIDVEQEGEYDYYAADGTVHQGVEFEAAYRISSHLTLSLNGTVAQNTLNSGDYDGNLLPNVPDRLLNASVLLQPLENLILFSDVRYVGKQYIDNENTRQGVIDPFTLVNAGARYRFGDAELSAKINNVFDVLYATFGYGYEWDGYWAYYWPGATRSYSLTVSYSL
ncbi:MAG: TonB-dependent receptor [Candidatus Marinimicrobia bacterium]|nr:TonB-dependent receptor [Candidatus Neomarinimicrobiota bacterium]